MRPRVVLLTVLLATATACSTAHAGTYSVAACTPESPGATVFKSLADPGFVTYDECPGSGIVARSVWDGGSASWLQGAYRYLDAPPGAIVQSISGEIKLERNNCTWGTNVVASNGDLGGTLLWSLSGLSATSCSIYGTTWIYRDLPVNATRVRIEARCGLGSCPRNGPATSGLPSVASARMRNIHVVIRDDTTPLITSAGGPLWTSDGWLRSVQGLSMTAADNTGIRTSTALVDEREVQRRDAPCSGSEIVPCPNAAINVPLDTSAFGSDGQHTLTLRVIDGAGNAAEVSRPVRIDNTPPGTPQAVAVEGGEGWHAANDLAVSWTAPVETRGAPIAGAEYELCEVPKGDCVRGSRDGAAPRLTAIKVPRDGEWQLRLWLRDAAGNEDRAQASRPVMVRVDSTPPALAFSAPNVQDPTLVSVHATDNGSGIAAGEIALRREGSQQWRALPATLTDGELSARIDDGQLARGRYELRAHVADRAGNERSTTATAAGAPAQLTLPLRLTTRLRAGRSLTRPATTLETRVNRGKLIRGRLTGPDGNPVADADVLVYARTSARTAVIRLVATLRTSGRGRFIYRAPAGPSRTIQFRYGGSSMIRSATWSITLRVRARSTLRANRRDVVNGDTVRFRGRVQGRIPRGGKLVEVQVLLRGHFRTFATTHTDRLGRWHYDYRFDGTRGRQDYRFRARLPREAGYPYATGGSKVVRVTVRGV